MASSMRIELVRGSTTYRLIEDDEFRTQWLALCSQCPWATAFQSLGYCTAWYQVYRSRFEPVLAISRDPNGRLSGLMPLAVAKNGRLVAAGAKQAEYQGWVCRGELGELFPWHALQAVRREFPRSVLSLQYLPPGTPIRWAAGPEVGPSCWLKSMLRPLLRFGNGQEIAESLKKRGNRSRLNRLERMGGLQFQRITDADELAAVFDAIIGPYDFRQAAVHGVAPFRNDALKKPFHLAMMRVPGLLHTTVLKVGDQVAAAHLGACGLREVQLGIIAHAPWLARLSPGKFLILYLAQMLLKEGVQQLDLTPGGDSYKERFANSHDEVHWLSFFPSPGRRTLHSLYERAKETGKEILKACHVEPRQLKSLRTRLDDVHPIRSPAGLVRSPIQWVRHRRELRVYTWEAKVPNIEMQGVRRDSLGDLLGYQAVGADAVPWQEYLARAMDRLENGQHVYTYAGNGQLLLSAWCGERPVKTLAGEGEPDAMVPSHVSLADFFAASHSRSRGLVTMFLRKILHEVAQTSEVAKIYVTVPANDRLWRQAVEEIALTYDHSWFEEVRLGKTRTWASALSKPTFRVE